MAPEDVTDIGFLKYLVAGMWAPLLAGTLYISYPNKLVWFMYFVSGAALKWVRVVT